MAKQQWAKQERYCIVCDKFTYWFYNPIIGHCRCNECNGGSYKGGNEVIKSFKVLIENLNDKIEKYKSENNKLKTDLNVNTILLENNKKLIIILETKLENIKNSKLMEMLNSRDNTILNKQRQLSDLKKINKKLQYEIENPKII